MFDEHLLVDENPKFPVLFGSRLFQENGPIETTILVPVDSFEPFRTM